MNIIKNGQILSYCYFNKIIKEIRTTFQSSALNQKHVRKVCYTALLYLTKFHFDNYRDSKEISTSATSNM